MEPNLDEIASVALQLSIESRAKRLLDSLDDLTLAEPERLWAAEASAPVSGAEIGNRKGRRGRRGLRGTRSANASMIVTFHAYRADRASSRHGC